MNRYAKCADVVRSNFEAERVGAVDRGASADRLAHLDTSIRAASELTDILDGAENVTQAQALVKDYRDALEAGQTARENEPGITSAMLIRDALDAL